MFEKEAEEYTENPKSAWKQGMTCVGSVRQAFKDGAEYGYNKGYHDAEEHYLNVIDSQHKLVDESKKKDFRKCMKCTDGTYQSGFKDGYNKANEWHYVKDGDLPKNDNDVLVLLKDETMQVDYYFPKIGWNISVNADVIAWKEIVLPKECK